MGVIGRHKERVEVRMAAESQRSATLLQQRRRALTLALCWDSGGRQELEMGYR